MDGWISVTLSRKNSWIATWEQIVRKIYNLCKVVDFLDYLSCLLPLQLANYQSYVSHFSPSTDFLISAFIKQESTAHVHNLYSDMKESYDANSQWPCLNTIRHHWQLTLVKDFSLWTMLDGKISHSFWKGANLSQISRSQLILMLT